MTYNLILIATVVISVIIGRALGKNGPKWKAPLIALGVFSPRSCSSIFSA